jgi:hypothetical protein
MSTTPSGGVPTPYERYVSERIPRYPQDPTYTKPILSSVEHDRSTSHYAHNWLWTSYNQTSEDLVKPLFESTDVLGNSVMHNARMSSFRSNGTTTTTQIETVTMTSSVPLLINVSRKDTYDLTTLSTLQLSDLYNMPRTHIYTSTSAAEQTFPIGLSVLVNGTVNLRDIAFDVIVAPLGTIDPLAMFYGTFVFSISTFARV